MNKKKEQIFQIKTGMNNNNFFLVSDDIDNDKMLTLIIINVVTFNFSSCIICSSNVAFAKKKLFLKLSTTEISCICILLTPQLIKFLRSWLEQGLNLLIEIFYLTFLENHKIARSQNILSAPIFDYSLVSFGLFHLNRTKSIILSILIIVL
jgi:hypothetical protein